MGFQYMKAYRGRRLTSHCAQAVVCRLHLTRSVNRPAIAKAMAHIPKRNFGLLRLADVKFNRFIKQKMDAHARRRAPVRRAS